MPSGTAWRALRGGGRRAGNRFDGLLNFSHAVAYAPAVGLEFLFAGASRADTAAQTREFFASAGQPGKQIIQLREFHLKLAFTGARMARENVEDQLRAINHAAAHAFFKIAKLPGSQIVI